MTDPTINSQTLSTGGTHTVFQQPRSRASMSTLPGVDGAYIQRYGRGPQIITGRGAIKSTTHALLKAAIRTIQNATNHAPATYTDGDGSTHLNCVLLSYTQAGEIKRESASSFWVGVQWTIVKLVAT
jgi:hypothetical protein